jgi:hypothetical protein
LTTVDFIDDARQWVIAISAFGAVILGVFNAMKIREVHISINSRMDQLLSARGDASKAQGAAEERERAKESGNGDNHITGLLKK